METNERQKCPLTLNDCKSNIGGEWCNDGNWVKCYQYKVFMGALKQEFMPDPYNHGVD